MNKFKTIMGQVLINLSQKQNKTFHMLVRINHPIYISSSIPTFISATDIINLWLVSAKYLAPDPCTGSDPHVRTDCLADIADDERLYLRYYY